jgi:DUF218 domain
LKCAKRQCEGGHLSIEAKPSRVRRARIFSSPAISLRWRPVIGRLIAPVLVLVVVIAGGWFERAHLLRGAADLWIVSDPVTRSDVAVVLGGGLETRPFAAAELYKEGLVTKILVSQVAQSRVGKLLALGHTELNRLVLLKLGVPDSAIATFGQANDSTDEEAVVLRDWANRNGVSSMVIPTEIFATRRLRWIIDREFAGTSVRVTIPALESDYTRADWWKTKAGLLAFQNEIVKYLYYRFKY